MASIYDIKVFGDPINLAIGKPASSDSADPANPAANANESARRHVGARLMDSLGTGGR